MSMPRAAKKRYFQDLVSSKNDSRSIWKAINNLTNKDTSKAQRTIKEISPDKLNNHFANAADSVIAKDKSKSNDLRFLKRFRESKTSKSTLTIPPVTVHEVSYHSRMSVRVLLLSLSTATSPRQFFRLFRVIF